MKQNGIYYFLNKHSINENLGWLNKIKLKLFIKKKMYFKQGKLLMNFRWHLIFFKYTQKIEGVLFA